MEDHFILLDKMSAVVKQVKTTEGYYFVYHDDSGAEIWIQTNEYLEPLGFKPHFSASNIIKLKVLGMENREHMLGGTCVAWVEVQDPINWEAGIAFLFDMPDYWDGMFTKYPAVEEMNVSMFASKVIFPQVEYETVAIDAEPLFTDISYSDALALTGNTLSDTGYIEAQLLSYALRINKFSGESFLWMTVKCNIGLIEVVCSPDSYEGTLEIGKKLICQGWLSARRPAKPEFIETLNRVDLTLGL